MAASAVLGHGDEDDRDPRIDPADLLIDFQPGLVGQAQVEENDVGRIGADALDPLRAGAGDLDPVGSGGERLAHLLRDQVRVIVDEQDPGHGYLGAAAPSGADAEVAETSSFTKCGPARPSRVSTPRILTSHGEPGTGNEVGRSGRPPQQGVAPMSEEKASNQPASGASSSTIRRPPSPCWRNSGRPKRPCARARRGSAARSRTPPSASPTRTSMAASSC